MRLKRVYQGGRDGKLIFATGSTTAYDRTGNLRRRSLINSLLGWDELREGVFADQGKRIGGVTLVVKAQVHNLTIG